MNAFANIAAGTTDLASRSSKHQLAVGEITTCQFGNPGDSDWSVEKDCNVQVEIIDRQFYDITKQYVFLVKKVGEEYVGRATVSRAPRNELDEPKGGVLYCTNARTYGASAQTWTRILTLEDAKRSLGF